MAPGRSEEEQGEQPLQTPWTFWYDRASASEPYADALQRLGTVHTVQAFWRYYCHLTRPGRLQPSDNLHLFRGEMQPAIEVRRARGRGRFHPTLSLAPPSRCGAACERASVAS